MRNKGTDLQHFADYQLDVDKVKFNERSKFEKLKFQAVAVRRSKRNSD